LADLGKLIGGSLTKPAKAQRMLKRFSKSKEALTGTSVIGTTVERGESVWY